MKNGWKVIRKKDRRSCTGDSRKRALTYPKNKEVQRPQDGGPLAVFETREAAREFMRLWTQYGQPFKSYCKIVKCLYKEASEHFLWELPQGVYTPYDFIISGRNEKHDLPLRTAFANSVTCLE